MSYRSSIWGSVRSDRCPNFVTAKPRTMGLSSCEIISTISVYVEQFCHNTGMSRTDKRTDRIAISISSVAFMSECRILLQKYYASLWQGVRTHPTPLVCLRHWILTMQKLDIHCGRWRSYDVIFVCLILEWVYSIQHAIPISPGYPFCEYLLVRRLGRIVYYLVKFKIMTKYKHIVVYKPDSVRSPPMQDNVTATECREWLMRIHTCVKRKADILSISYGISVYQWHGNILVDVC